MCDARDEARDQHDHEMLVHIQAMLQAQAGDIKNIQRMLTLRAVAPVPANAVDEEPRWS